MSNIAAFPDDDGAWAAPEVMAEYRAKVEARADAIRAQWPNAKKALEISMPNKAAEALYLLKETDQKKADVAEHIGVSRRELDRFIYHYSDLWDKQRPMLAAQFTEAAKMMAEAAIQKAENLLSDPLQLAETPLNHIAIAAGVFLDKAATLNGMATAKVEHIVVGKLDEFEALRAEAQKRLADRKTVAIEAEIVTNGAEMAEA